MPGAVVLGLGNALTGDDGAGPYVIQALQATHVFPEGVTVAVVGTPGLDLAPCLAGLDVLILVDTVRSDAVSGTMRAHDKSQILQHAPNARLVSHDFWVKETLLSLEFASRAPHHVILVGVAPGSVRTGVGLSDPVKAAIPCLASEILAQLRRSALPRCRVFLRERRTSGGKSRRSLTAATERWCA